MKNFEEIIKNRHSVRDYLDKKIEDEKIDILKKEIKNINEEYDLNIQFISDNKDIFDNLILNYGRIKNCNNYIALIGKKSSKLEELVGYNGEKLVLLAQELGLNTCWVAGTYKKKQAKVVINNNEELVCVIAIGYGKTSGTNRKSKKISDVSISKEYPTWYKKGVEMALLAPTAMNQQKFFFEYLGDNKVSIKTKGGHMTNVDLGICKYHFELGADKDISWN